MSIEAGRFRHRVRVEQKVKSAKDTETGFSTQEWEPVTGMTNISASVEPLSTREFMAAQQQQGEMTARIVMRFRSGILETMRLVHLRSAQYGGNVIYYITGKPLADKDSGVSYLTIPVSEGAIDE